jgi:hypothetical protein
MKLSPAKSTKPKDIRQAQLQAQLAAAGPMRDRFPQLSELQVDLAFASSTADPSPSAQRFTLYPAARAYFQYRCPCADCDGVVDLGDAVRELAASAAQSPGRSSGQLTCQGTRLRNSAFSQPCSMQVKYQLRTLPRRDAEVRVAAK